MNCFHRHLAVQVAPLEAKSRETRDCILNAGRAIEQTFQHTVPTKHLHLNALNLFCERYSGNRKAFQL
jgi:hypothetical protein